jgi:hypothetical protein
MNQAQTFEQFLASQTPHVGLLDFGINLGLTTIFAFVLSLAYTRYGTSISNRRLFARNLVIIAMTTMVIITVVKSSLALSLGLVGALSIVRFRTPIKEPEELAFLFLSIAVGLGLGAGQREVVALGFAIILAVIMLRHLIKSPTGKSGMHLSVASDHPTDGLLDRVVKVLNEHASSVELRRVDETAGGFQSDFLVKFESFDSFSTSKKNLRGIDERLRISFLDNSLL